MSERGTYIVVEPATVSGMVTVRADLADPVVVSALGDGGVPVPAPLALAEGEAGSVLWMSPDELLILTGDVAGCSARLAAVLHGHHAMVLDVSDARLVFDLTGDAVAEVLAKGAPCDLSPAAFPPGTVRRTHLGGLAVAIWRLTETHWQITCFRSFAHHLHAWLTETAQPGSEVRSGLV